MSQKTAMIVWVIGVGLVLCGCGTSAPSAPRSPHLTGSTSARNYTSSRGGFSVPFPVSPEVGGAILSDTPQSVTFHDNWGSLITFSSFPFTGQSSMMATLRSQGRERALAEFAERQYGSDIAVHYHTNVLDGAISFIFVRPVGSGTGVAMFVHGLRVYSVETDMLPGVQLLAQNDERSRSERLDWLEGRAVALAQTMDVK